jgi:hypothetical protein
VRSRIATECPTERAPDAINHRKRAYVPNRIIGTHRIDTWLTPNVISGSTSGWVEGNAAMVMDDGDGTYTVHNITLNANIVIDHPIPLASAAVW